MLLFSVILVSLSLSGSECAFFEKCVCRACVCEAAVLGSAVWMDDVDRWL